MVATLPRRPQRSRRAGEPGTKRARIWARSAGLGKSARETQCARAKQGQVPTVAAASSTLFHAVPPSVQMPSVARGSPSHSRTYHGCGRRAPRPEPPARRTAASEPASQRPRRRRPRPICGAGRGGERCAPFRSREGTPPLPKPARCCGTRVYLSGCGPRGLRGSSSHL